MTPTISPVTGALPQQPAPTAANCSTPPPPLLQQATAVPTPQAPQAVVGASPMTTTPPATTVGGGTVQAAQGAMAVSPEQLIPAIQGLIGSINNLIASLQGGVAGGGAPAGTPGQVGQCGMAGCTMNHAADGAAALAAAPTQGGANAAPTPSAAPAGPVRQAASDRPAARAAGAGTVDPSSVKDKASTNGLQSAPKRGLEEAHTFGLPLVSGARPGGPSSSDHTHGNAIDVGTLPIGVASSDGGTEQMKAYAEYMRQQGKAGNLDVKYVIRDGQIASSNGNWEWRTYTYPGKSASEMEAMKQSNRGEYNRMQHYDHVHVSFN